MATTGAIAASQLHQLVYYHLDNEMLDTANFLAGRLHALEPRSPDSLHLLALTFLRLQRHRAAYDYSVKYGASGRHLGCAYVHALACRQLGKNFEGIQALERCKASWSGKMNWKKHSDTSRRHLPDAPAVCTLMGKLYQAHGDDQKAADCFLEAHKANPFTWDAFEGLCQVGVDLTVENMFRPENNSSSRLPEIYMDEVSSTRSLQRQYSTPDPFMAGHNDNQTGSFVLPMVKGGQPQTVLETPTAHGGSHDDIPMGGVEEQVKRTRNDHNVESLAAPKRTISGHVPTSPTDGAPRRSNRIFGQAAPRPKVAETKDRTRQPAVKGRSTVGRVVSGNRKVMPPVPAEKEKEKEKDKEKRRERPTVAAAATRPQASMPDVQAEQQAMVSLLDNFRQLAIGFYAASRFETDKAIDAFTSLSTAQRDTPWVLAQLGKVYYEAADNENAEECFARLLKIQPSRLEDMEVYSTVLWHLKKEATLVYLCHLLRDHNYNAPQTWCAIGNAFSLQREHDFAINAFKRSTQLDPKFAYGWTLMGHECIANEEYDAALTAFRRSLGVDKRCYNGWYGLGKTYEKKGQTDKAERHYRIAASINGSNSTLPICVGAVMEKLGNKQAALASYSRALEIAPHSALAKFKKARVMMQLHLPQDALVILEGLKDQAPDEANVHFLLGKCYKLLGMKSNALKALTSALNLDTKAAPFIQEAIEQLDNDDSEGDFA
ncbi:TPR-like protein [Piedraia hortae CBS 480.64]|uniref:TPR-like protein n=1 Tax=Piedraia hortae CBS 480.64 TaxID=1314780 RepID=A0A6A7BTG0_9PEZI|nr:TPR-like protein [Piedraia hortae CBS 480.64]